MCGLIRTIGSALGGSFKSRQEIVFYFDGCSHAHFLMQPDSVVVIDIFGNIVLKLLASLIKVMGQLLPFHADEEGFCDRIIQRDSWIRERLRDFHISEVFSENEVSILRTLIAMKSQSAGATSHLKSRIESRLDQCSIDLIGNAICKNSPGKEIDDDADVMKKILDSDISDVADPN